MVEQVCPECNENAITIDEIDGNSYCEFCGTVISENEFRSEVELVSIDDANIPVGRFVSDLNNTPTFMKTKSATINYAFAFASQPQGKLDAIKYAKDICSVLKLNKTFEDQALNRVMQYMGDKWKRGHGAKLIVASCVYITCRLNRKPITLLDVADSINESCYVLGRTYTRIVQTLKIELEDADPSLFLERAILRLEIPSELVKEVTQRAIRIISIAKDDSWIVTGRRPAAVAAAAITISMSSSGISHTVAAVAEHLNCAVATVKTRQRELRCSLAKIAIQELPWGATINEKNVENYLPAVLKCIEFKAKAKALQPQEVNEDEKKIIPMPPKIALADLPPSFAKHNIAREERRRKICLAKEKLSKIVSEAQTVTDPILAGFKVKKEKTEENPPPMVVEKKRKEESSFDESVFIIERLLLRGIDEKVLLEAENLNDLFMAEFPVIDVDSDELTKEEIKEYIRSPEEVEMLKQLDEIQTPTKKKLKIEV